MPAKGVWWLLVALLHGAQCATPTSIVVDVLSEVPCERDAGVALVVGRSPADLAASPPSAVATRCEAAGGGLVHRGSAVIVPASDTGETIALALLTRNDAASPDRTCRDPAGQAGCIVARRKVRFRRHEQVTVQVTLSLKCLGVACPVDATCERGACAMLGPP